MPLKPINKSIVFGIIVCKKQTNKKTNNKNNILRNNYTKNVNTIVQWKLFFNLLA